MSISGLVGLTAKSLCASLAYDAAIKVDDYESEDDNAFDWQDWNPDFYASMAFSGGNLFAGEGDTGRRREFWNWYPDTVLKIIKNPGKSLIVRFKYKN
jgi:hypothetical protein